MKSFWQTELAGTPVPERPNGVSDRNWSIFLAHCWGGRTMADLAAEHGINHNRIRQIIDAVHVKIRNRARFGIGPAKERP